MRYVVTYMKLMKEIIKACETFLILQLVQFDIDLFLKACHKWFNLFSVSHHAFQTRFNTTVNSLE